jgi:hypothetical protein
MLTTLVIAILALAVLGLFGFAAHALRKASRTADDIFADVLGHRGAHEQYAEELAEWRKSLG